MPLSLFFEVCEAIRVYQSDMQAEAQKQRAKAQAEMMAMKMTKGQAVWR